jgi:diguanylate cyclase (GGDEF)-like protein
MRNTPPWQQMLAVGVIILAGGTVYLTTVAGTSLPPIALVALVAIIVAAAGFGLVTLGTRPHGERRRRIAQTSAGIAVGPHDIDPVTGVLNADSFRAACAAEQERLPGALLLIDMARFSEIHSRYGAADAVEGLRLIVRVIKEEVRTDDIVGRVERGQFGVFLRGAPQELSIQIAERICTVVEDTIFMTKENSILDLSVDIGGVVTVPGSAARPFDIARDMLEQVKLAGGGNVAVAAIQ